MVDLKLQSRVLEDQLENLSKAKKEIVQYDYFKSVAKTVIPSDKDQAQAVLDITKMAQESGILIQSVSFPSSNLGGGTTTLGSSTTPSTSTSSTSQALSQAKPVTGIKGLYSLELTITPQTGSDIPPQYQVNYAKLHNFLTKIENNRRTAQITQVSIQPLTTGTEANPILNFTLTVNIFIKP